jgi:hypothetical protein
MENNIEIFLTNAKLAKSYGQYDNAVGFAIQAAKDVADIFGKRSVEGGQIVIFIAELALEGYEKGVEPKVNFIRCASFHISIAIHILEDGNHKDTIEYQKSNYLAGIIFARDTENLIPTLKYFDVLPTRKEMINIAKNFLYTSIKIAHSLVESKKFSENEIKEIAMLCEKAREELIELLPEEDRPKRRKVKERNFYHEDFGWLKTYIDEKTGEVLFDAQNICDILGISLEEASKMVGENDMTKEEIQIIDEKS